MDQRNNQYPGSFVTKVQSWRIFSMMLDLKNFNLLSQDRDRCEGLSAVFDLIKGDANRSIKCNSLIRHILQVTGV
jgi:hypothetical protein